MKTGGDKLNIVMERGQNSKPKNNKGRPKQGLVKWDELTTGKQKAK